LTGAATSAAASWVDAVAGGPQMVIRVGYPKVSAGQPDIRTPRQEPEVIDVRCVPSQRVIRPPEPDPPEPQPPEAASGPGRTNYRLTAH